MAFSHLPSSLPKDEKSNKEEASAIPSGANASGVGSPKSSKPHIIPPGDFNDNLCHIRHKCEILSPPLFTAPARHHANTHSSHQSAFSPTSSR